jgi:hypothetical protein
VEAAEAVAPPLALTSQRNVAPFLLVPVPALARFWPAFPTVRRVELPALRNGLTLATSLLWFARDHRVFIDSRQDPYSPELVFAQIETE